MSIKSDKWIRQMCENLQEPLISPFFAKSISKNDKGQKIPSYGLSSYGYDVRLGRNFKISKTNYSAESIVHYGRGGSTHYAKIPQSDVVVDVMDVDSMTNAYIPLDNLDWIIIPPGGFLLAHTEESFNMWRKGVGVCMGKSTIARTGVIVTVTPLEPEWKGFLTLEITNPTPLPVRLWAGVGIAQIQFVESDEECEVSYMDRGGKYQNQAQEPVTARLL